MTVATLAVLYFVGSMFFSMNTAVTGAGTGGGDAATTVQAQAGVQTGAAEKR